jgi:hypothetical protein
MHNVVLTKGIDKVLILAPNLAVTTLYILENAIVDTNIRPEIFTVAKEKDLKNADKNRELFR